MPDITITTTAPQAQRIATAVGQHRNLGRDATAAEVKDFLVTYLKYVVKEMDSLEYKKQETSSPLDIG